MYDERPPRAGIRKPSNLPTRDKMTSSTKGHNQINPSLKSQEHPTGELTKCENDPLSAIDHSIFGNNTNIAMSQIINKEASFKTGRSQRTLEGLTNSIKENDVIHPVVVKKHGDKYVIVCGHRRIEACRKLGRETIPSRILKDDVSPKKEFELRLRENLDRKNLNAIEMAAAVHDYIKALRPELDLQGMLNLFINSDRRKKQLGVDAGTVTAIKDITGRSSSTIRNWLSLLQLTDKAMNFLIQGELSASKGYVLASHLNHPDLNAIVERAVSRKVTRDDLKGMFEPPEAMHEILESQPSVSNIMTELDQLEKDIAAHVIRISHNDRNAMCNRLDHIYKLLNGSILLPVHSDKPSTGKHDDY